MVQRVRSSSAEANARVITLKIAELRKVRQTMGKCEWGKTPMFDFRQFKSLSVEW